MYAIECNAASKGFYEKVKVSHGKTTGFIRKVIVKREKTKVAAVDNVTFHVAKGEIFGIIGPNGSGKSTLIRMFSTLILPDSGELHIFGRDVVTESRRVRQMINRVSVDAAFFKKLSAWENLSYAARLYGFPPKQVKEKAIHILESMFFPRDKINQSLENLSRGMQQKVAIARALFTSPVLLLLDEPTTGLDPVSKRQLQEYILKIRENHDSTVLLSSHDMDEVERICDRIAIIHNGKFVACDPPEVLKKRFSNNGKATSLEDVFSKLTGMNIVEDAE